MRVTARAVDFLSTLDLFSALTDAELAELASTARPFEVPRGAAVFRQGDQADEMYCIADGTVRITVRLAGEEELEVARLGPGSVVGEMALVDDDVRSASARAVDPVRGWRIERWSFDVLRAAFRPSSYKTVYRLAELILSRLRATTRDLVEGAGPALRVADTAGVPPRGVASPREHAVPRGEAAGGGAVGGGSAGDGRGAPATGAGVGHLDRENLALLPLFRDFTGDELEEVLGHMERVEVPRGRTIFDAGEPADRAFVVTEGAVESRGLAPAGVVKLALWGPGRMFGEEALFGPEPRITRALTREDTTLLALDARHFRALHREGAVVAYKLSDAATRLLVAALRSANRRRTWQATRGAAGQTTSSDTLQATLGEDR